MPKIHKLPPHLIAQIAAGEVIERPAYAVKELIENAIDANANHIQIYLEEAGLKKIMVIDNGDGMSREDLLECYKHHTTSKIDSDTAHIIGIKSFGFRGEALSSISAVSEMTIKSRRKNDVSGTEIHLHKGNLTETQTVGMPMGTYIVIENLFAAFPARKKFLKSQRTEFRHSMDIVLQAALAYPHIRFQLFHNERMVFDFPKQQVADERIKQLYGNDIASQMMPIKHEESPMLIRGTISKPHIMSTSTNKQYIFINNRPVYDTAISQTVKDAYGRMLDSSSYPLFALFIEIPHEMVDVNVHPRKEQVAITNNDTVLQFIKTAVAQTLTTPNTSYRVLSQKDNPFIDNMPDYASTVLRDAVLPWNIQQIAKLNLSSDAIQVHNLYIIMQTYEGVILIDQHAAHERVLYEQFVAAFQKEKQLAKPYLLPQAVVLQLASHDVAEVITRKNVFTSMGFLFEEFGQNGIKITHIPRFFKDHDIPRIFMEMINQTSEDIDSQSTTMLTFLACRNAVKAGDKLSKKQIKELVKQLEKTPNNATCPHGRPTKAEITLRDIHKLFKRR